MKVNIDVTEEVTDEQRMKIADVLDGKVSRREAKRDEIKGFIWEEGSGWEEALDQQWRALTGDDEPDDEDLLGTDDLDLEDLL